MQTINIHAAKTQLSRLVDEAAKGNEIIIARAGKPVARLVPLAPPPQAKRVLGALAGQLDIPDDFDAPLPDDVLDAFEGRNALVARYACPDLGTWRSNPVGRGNAGFVGGHCQRGAVQRGQHLGDHHQGAARPS